MALVDTLIVTATVDGTSSLQARWPTILNTKTWRIRKTSKPEIIRLGENRVRWRQSVELISLLPGENDLLLLPVQFREGEGNWQKASWTAIAIFVHTQITEPKLENARDITGIEHLPKPGPPQVGVFWIATVTISLLVLITVIWLIARKHRNPATPLTADEWALRELERIEKLQLPGKNKGTRYVTFVANVIRAFLEKRLAFPARRQTTPEFLQSVADSDALDAEQRDMLREFLTRSDHVKYAGVEPSARECEALQQCAVRIIEANKEQETTTTQV